MKLSGGLFQVASELETKTYLTTASVEIQDSARVLWDTYSGYKGLLDADKYDYDPVTRTYKRKTDGRVVSDDDIVNGVRRVSTAQRNEMRKQTQQLVAGGIILAVYYSRMRSLMNALYSTIWLVTVGGFVFDNDTARNLFYLWVLSQFNYLDRFVDDLDNGAASLNGRSVIRSGMYGEAGNGLYQNMVLEQKEQDGYQEARRLLGDNENHCHDSEEREGCIELAERGWVDIRLLVPIGDAVCMSNCHCRIEYRRRKKNV